MADALICPYGTSRSFTNERLFYAHVRDWPGIAELNGLNLDGSPKATDGAPQVPAESLTRPPEATERPVTPTRAKRATKTRTKR